MEEKSELDITSEASVRPLPTSGEEAAGGKVAKKNPRKMKSQRMQIFFKCCKVYAQVPIPERVLKSEISIWRFHCPRCAQLVEIPL